jgi:hypothetical protein
MSCVVYSELGLPSIHLYVLDCISDGDPSDYASGPNQNIEQYIEYIIPVLLKTRRVRSSVRLGIKYKIVV